MTKQEITEYLDQHGDQKIKFAFADIDGILRGKVIHRRKFLEGLEAGYGFCDVVFGWDSADVVYDNAKLTGWHSGYPDAPARIDLSTFRKVPWENDLPFFLADFSRADGIDLPACPRSLLKRIVQQCTDLGYHAEYAQEFEWFNFRETPQSLQEKDFRHMQPLTPGMFGYSILRPSGESDYFNDLFDWLSEFDIPLEGLHTETGPGVYEAAIIHDEIMKAADKAVLLKTAVKEIAYRHGIVATFMAKWNAELPGCSGHIHQSLWSPDRSRNLFYEAEDADKMSPLMKQFIAGQLHCLPHILPMFAPTVNSYKRLVEGAWAPTTITWAIENRTTALRVINDSAGHTRVEHRVAGADSNPYLAMAAALASGLYGIKNNLSLDIAATQGNGYENKTQGTLPANLRDATQAMKASLLAVELFGEAFVDHFTSTRDWEWRQYTRQVSDWELRRYFEII